MIIPDWRKSFSTPYPTPLLPIALLLKRITVFQGQKKNFVVLNKMNISALKLNALTIRSTFLTLNFISFFAHIELQLKKT